MGLEPVARGAVPGLKETSVDHILVFVLTDLRMVWIGVFKLIHLCEE